MNLINRVWKILVGPFSFLVIVPSVFLQIIASDAIAATGFGNGGIVTTPIGMGSNAKALAIQSDGKLIAAGFAFSGTPICTPVPSPPFPPADECRTPSAFALARYNSDGSLDISFGTDGIVTTAIGMGGNANALAIQSDGKLIAAGDSSNGTQTAFALARYNTDGTPDTAFGTNGIVTTAIGTGSAARFLAIQSDGKLVAAGQANGAPGQASPQFALVRYNTDGSLDMTFGTNGIVTTAISSYAIAYALAIQSDGKLVAAGTTQFHFVLVRYNPDGSLDPTFGAGGIVTTAATGIFNEANALAIQLDGKLVAAGYANGAATGGHSDFALIRYNTGGSLDTTFGTGGIVTTAIGSYDDQAKGLAIQSDGKIVASGYAVNANVRNEFGSARYNTDGSLDATFGAAGKVTTAIGDRNDAVNALAIQSNGKLVAAGYSSTNNGQTVFALVRYDTDGSLDTTSTNITTTTTTTTTTSTTTTTTTTTTVPKPLPDVGIDKIKAPGKADAGKTKKVEVVVKKFGKKEKGEKTPQTRTLLLTVTGGVVIGSYVETIDLTKHDEVKVKFEVLFTTPGTSSLRATLSPADSNPANDTLTETVNVKVK